MRIDVENSFTIIPGLRRKGAHGIWLELSWALLELAGGEAELLHRSERAWASATFCGSRHRVLLRFDGAEAIEAGEAFMTALPDHEFAIPGQLVADAAVVAVEQEFVPKPKLTVEAELLLLEEC